MSAIPLLLFHAKLTSTTGQIIDGLEMASLKALNAISNSHFNPFELETNQELPDRSLSEENRQVPTGTIPDAGGQAAAKNPA
jgi:hypothetical protein